MLREFLQRFAPKTERAEPGNLTAQEGGAQSKDFKLKAHEIAPVALGRGGCIASDRITVHGSCVGYMYREAPKNDLDSGWRFLAGDETEAFMADSRRHGIYDINTIVNCDPDILPFLDAEEGSEFERGVDGVLASIQDDGT